MPGPILAGKGTAYPGQITATFTRTSIPATQDHVNNLLFSYGAVHSRYSLEIPDAFHIARETIRNDLAPGL